MVRIDSPRTSGGGRRSGYRTAKNKGITGKIENLGLSETLIVVEKIDDNLRLASRNLSKTDVRDLTHIDPLCLISNEKVLVTAGALKGLEAALS